MKKIIVVLLAGLLSSILIFRAVRAQTPPSAQTLISQAKAALKKAGSAHVVGTANESLAGANAAQLTGTMSGDVSWRTPPAAHLTGSASVHGGKVATGFTVPFELILVNNRLALRLMSGRWQCTTYQKLAKTVRMPAAKNPMKTKFKLQQATTVGPDTVNGVAVWHVQEKGAVAAQTGKTTRMAITADLYISQADSTLVRAAVSSSGGAAKTTVTLTASVDFSAYGETVQAQLPSACSSPAKKASHQAATYAGGFVLGLDLLLQPATLLR